MTREQRLKDREIKRILHEEELSRLREGSMASEASTGRTSERHRQAEMEKREKELQKIVQEQEDDWYFDCAVCGTHGKNLVSLSLHALLLGFSLTVCRTMGVIAWLVRNVMSGSILGVMASHQNRLKRTTSISSVLLVEKQASS